MRKQETISLFRDPLDPRELSFGFSQPHVEPNPASGTGQPRRVEGPSVEQTNEYQQHFGGITTTPLDFAPPSYKQNLDSDPKKLARANDPGTSKAAAKTVKRFAKNIHALILWALEKGDGTFYDIARRATLEPSAVWRRLNELERKGLIEPTGEERKGPTGRLCRVWRLKGL